MHNLYLGVDIGSVSINIAAIDEKNNLIFKLYKRNSGNPIELVKKAFKKIQMELNLDKYKVNGVGVTGSGRQLIAYILGADIVKNEITAHARAATYYYPEAGTIFEIGGQDSKLIIVEDGIAVDFAMNTVCAAGTGSFLDHQAERLGIAIEDFGGLALKAKRDIRIAGRCTVFAESDMISKQQYGFSKAEIIKGLSEALVRNYMNNLVRNRVLKGKYIFQGGVAANAGIKAAFEAELNSEVIIPEYYDVMGAIGIAMLTKRDIKRNNKESSFRGFEITDEVFRTDSFECGDCSNNCEIIKIIAEDNLIAVTGDRCGKWSASLESGSKLSPNEQKDDSNRVKENRYQKNKEYYKSVKSSAGKNEKIMEELDQIEKIKEDVNDKENDIFV